MKHDPKVRGLLPLAAIVAATIGLAACGDRNQPTTTTGAAPATTPPANTAAPATPPTATPGAEATRTLAAEDRDFITMAASSGMMEVQASRMALEKSKNNHVRDFAQRMIDDHMKANEELRNIARTAGMSELPTAMVQVHASHMDRLQALGGVEFDREFVAQAGVAGHTEAIDLFEKASRDAANPEIRAFAEKQLPTLREHLEQSQKLAKTVGVTEERMKSARAKQERGVVGMGAATGTPSVTGAPPATGAERGATDQGKAGAATASGAAAAPDAGATKSAPAK
jgi:putative membrane protein